MSLFLAVPIINTIYEAVRKLMNTFKVDGLTRALTRQLYIADFLSFSVKDDRNISFNQTSRIKDGENPWRKRRISIKPGKLLKKIFNVDKLKSECDIKDKDIELFSNLSKVGKCKANKVPGISPASSSNPSELSCSSFATRVICI